MLEIIIPVVVVGSICVCTTVITSYVGCCFIKECVEHGGM